MSWKKLFKDVLNPMSTSNIKNSQKEELSKLLQSSLGSKQGVDDILPGVKSLGASGESFRQNPIYTKLRSAYDQAKDEYHKLSQEARDLRKPYVNEPKDNQIFALRKKLLDQDEAIEMLKYDKDTMSDVDYADKLKNLMSSKQDYRFRLEEAKLGKDLAKSTHDKKIREAVDNLQPSLDQAKSRMEAIKSELEFDSNVVDDLHLRRVADLQKEIKKINNTRIAALGLAGLAVGSALDDD